MVTKLPMPAAHGKVYGGLECRGIDSLIPGQCEPTKSPVLLRRFATTAS